MLLFGKYNINRFQPNKPQLNIIHSPIKKKKNFDVWDTYMEIDEADEFGNIVKELVTVNKFRKNISHIMEWCR